MKKINKKTKLIFIFWVLMAIFSGILSIYLAKNIHGTDFPVYYITAKKMIDPQFIITDIYQTTTEGMDPLPEKYPLGNYFIYTPPIAALLSPLGFLSYFMAKSVLIFLNIMSYFSAIVLILKQIQRCSWLLFLSAALFTWMPFVVNIAGAQVNALVLFLIASSIYMASQKKPSISGCLLGVAALFKIFPLGIAFILGGFNRKITLLTLSVFFVSLLLPGTDEWLEALPTVSAGHTPVYRYAKENGIVWQLLFTSSIACLSLYGLSRAKVKDLLALSAYSVPTVFVAMPVVQYHHLVMLVIPYIVIFFKSSSFPLPIFSRMILVSAILHINLKSLWPFLPHAFWSLLVIWAVMSFHLLVEGRARSEGLYDAA